MGITRLTTLRLVRVLVAEDERRVADAVARGLRREGLAVDVAYDGQAALDKARLHPYEVLVLDRDLPELHGDDVCRALREEDSDCRVLMLTAAGGVDDLVDGLALGADDYLAKPFAFAELLARLRALARRSRPALPAVLRRGDIELDPARRTVHRRGRPVDLTPKELALLEHFLMRPTEVVTRTDLLEKVWDMTFDPGSNVVDVNVARLRKKLETGGATVTIVAKRGQGFVLDVSASAETPATP